MSPSEEAARRLLLSVRPPEDALCPIELLARLVRDDLRAVVSGREFAKRELVARERQLAAIHAYVERWRGGALSASEAVQQIAECVGVKP